MKRSVLFIKELFDGKVELAMMQDVASEDEIISEFGSEVARAYLGGCPRFYAVSDGLHLVDENHVSHYVTLGTIYRQKDFERYVASMKAAGKRLKKIVDFERKNTVLRAVVI